ncbi:3-hydroxyacyl-CoA dehydrogenase NAD-binding domain-containing protein [Campylobacter jejuni]|uniref:3-hydroxyacyl-CoA dehydrogenase NAD-binding domain-containing protein n=1 Tax=Campylobacter jejuni TaxID=197 RepID=UPI003005D497
MKKTNIIDFGLMGKQISALFYLLGHEIGVYNKSKLNIYEFEKQIKLLQRKIDFSNFNAGKINIYQHIEDLKNSLTIESLNEDLNLKKEIMQILRDNNNIVFSNSSSLSMDDLNCDFIHFFNTIYIKLIELCDSNLERFTPLKDLKKLGFHIICSKGNRGALANLLLFNEISSFFKIIEKYDYNFKECQTVYGLLYEKRNLLNIIDTIGIELCDKICKNLKEDDENFYHPKIFKKAL